MRTGYLLTLIAALSVIFAGIAFAEDAAQQQATQQPGPEGAQMPDPNAAPADQPENAEQPSNVDPALAAEIDKCIAQLGDTDYKKRREAYERLHAIGQPTLDKLKEALKGEDAEIRASAQRLIEEIEGPDNGRNQANAMQVRVVGGGQVKLVFVGPQGAVAVPAPEAAAVVVKEYSLEETVDKVKIRYEFIDRGDNGIDVVVIKTDAEGKTTSEPGHFKNADDMKKTNEPLFNKYNEAVKKGPVAQRGGLSSIPMLGRMLEMRLKAIEKLEDAEARAKMLKSMEDELLAGLKQLDVIEQKLAGRSLRNALDFDAWILRPACAIPGVQVRPVDEALKAQLNIKGGLLVTGVAEDSPLKDTLKPYDIITEADGTAVNTVEELNGAWTAHKAGPGDQEAAVVEKFEVKILRAGKEETITITPPKPAAPPAAPEAAPAPVPPPAPGPATPPAPAPTPEAAPAPATGGN